ncbi:MULTISPECIES: hypothetical protein [Bacillus]|uniref:Uncharacterized protein n=2 Tax=Bacillus cereus group TaxID=86661 RepID=A0A2A7DDQ5_BACAN|nr:MULTISPECIES: hypothetical protein [Bacillus]OTW67648.1 hypothetical protein BK707_21035 [Bacillus thuringiensis serovar coreanensis]OTX44265.1 hypothetical protein BK724_16330 [Bacillus thuringiensis serovar sooncheon]OTX53428.1 hypothetical protein BK725_14715 [Bacillus thuringiensis serovar guiyangiensis]OTX67749.1 hypothetical protein BK727_15735 [Bacillus thuringiensis serovar roskildiensis]PDZ18127.1 hypothetical protein CON16_06700 [Bacillus anthracis]
MAICLLMTKEFENEEIVVYQYYPSESPAKIGKMHYNKKERMFYEIEQAPVDSLNMREYYFNCACTRIVRCLRKNEEFPDSMAYEA